MEIQSHYEIAGNGPAVLLLHGWGGCVDSVRPIMNALAVNHRVVAVDFPGHGKSAAPQTPWSVDDYCKSLMQVIEKEGLRGCDVFAHSFGARVTIKLAAANPGLFRKIALTGAAGVRPKRSLKYYCKVYSYKLMRKCTGNRLFCGLMKLFGVDVKARIENAGSDDYKALPPAMRRTFSLIVNEDLTKHLSKIKSSVLLLWGEEDMDTPLWMAKVMEKKIPDCGLVTYPGATHFAYLERLHEFIPVLNYFFDGGNAA